MEKSRKKLAKLFLVFFIASLLFSCGIGICCLEHECIGEGCIICYEIDLVKHIFDSLFVASLMYSYINVFKRFILRIRYIWQIRYYLTPIKLKVEFIG